MFLTDITLGQAGLYALLGYAIVFFGLILLMLVVILIGKCFTAGAKKPQPQPEAPAPAPTAEPAAARTKPSLPVKLLLFSLIIKYTSSQAILHILYTF